MHRVPGRQYYLLSITVVHVYCCTLRCQKKLKLKKQGFFVKFLSLVAFWLKGLRLPGQLPWLRLWFWDKIESLSSFLKKIQLKQN